jgi:hypothetical protein
LILRKLMTSIAVDVPTLGSTPTPGTTISERKQIS